jgi:hypothetical protein
MEDSPFWAGVKLAAFSAGYPSAQAPSVNGGLGAPPGAKPGGIVGMPKTTPPVGNTAKPIQAAQPGGILNTPKTVSSVVSVAKPAQPQTRA